MKTIQRLAAAAVLGLASLAHAAFPDKPIKILIGFPAGGPLDAHARLLAKCLATPPITLPASRASPSMAAPRFSTCQPFFQR